MPTYKTKDSEGNFTGSWYVKFIVKNHYGISKQVKKMGFKSKKEAEEYEREYIYNLTLTPDIPFKSLLKQFLEDKKGRIKKSSYATLYCAGRLKYFSYFNEMKVNKIKPLHIRNWQNIILKTDLKPSTLKLLSVVLKNIFTFAVKYRGLKINPMASVESIGTFKRSKKIEVLTLEEFKQVLELTNNKYKIVFKFLFFTGCRIGEALALTLDDIDLENKVININKTLFWTKEEKYIFQTPKTESSIRSITIPDNLIEELKEHINKSLYVMEDKRIFNYTNQTIRNSFKKAVEKALNKDCSIHILRHSHASLLINNGVDVLYISKRLGHSKPSMTLNVYSHLYKMTEDRARDKLNELEKEI